MSNVSNTTVQTQAVGNLTTTAPDNTTPDFTNTTLSTSNSIVKRFSFLIQNGLDFSVDNTAYDFLQLPLSSFTADNQVIYNNITESLKIQLLNHISRKMGAFFISDIEITNVNYR
jgi:hypothetical protein